MLRSMEAEIQNRKRTEDPARASIPTDREHPNGWGIGIAESKDKKHWMRIGEVERDPNATYERKGYCAPCAQVVDGKLHLFYQTYGNGRKEKWLMPTLRDFLLLATSVRHRLH